MDPKDYPQPSVAVDVVVLTIKPTSSGNALCVGLLNRDQEPFAGAMCLPGTFVHIDETLSDAMKRLFAQKTGIKKLAWNEQLYTFDSLRRDPRWRVMSTAYIMLVHGSLDRLTQNGFMFTPINCLSKLPKLAFDHNDIISMALQRLRGKISYSDIAFGLLGKTFTLRDLCDVHEAVLGKKIAYPAFRQRVVDSGLIELTGEMSSGNAHRPAKLYRPVQKTR